ncbi:MAG: universal stress protein [Xanthobacteraceae bacterium]|nr:universal stress protein [Xanthobacteraceae bacterium]
MATIAEDAQAAPPPVKDVRHLAVGDIVDGFHLEAQLPAGGMAGFWRVRHPDFSLPLIMKIPLLRAGEDPITIVGYEMEHMILPRLSGSHVPRFIAAGPFEQPYIVMEFIDGRSVRELLTETPLAPDRVAAIGAQIAFALHDIHRQHVLHLDLKPSNVFLRPNGEAVLIDYGLGRHELLPDLVAEEIDGPVGTGPYVAPEQVLRDRTDPRSDIFALGVIMYFLATGERPFGEPQRAAEWRRRLWRDPFPPRSWNPQVPPWLQEIILRCLEVDPDRRYATAAQLAFDLQHPGEVVLTRRAERLHRDGFLTVLLRRLRASRAPAPLRRKSVSGMLAGAPIVVAAIDLNGDTPSTDALRDAVRRVLVTDPSARLACVHVLKTARLAIDPWEDAQGRNLHLQRMIELKHWARALPIDPTRITYHVLEGSDPGATLVDYARNNQIDHLLLGARGATPLRRYLGSTSTHVVAQAPCTVTVVRTHRTALPAES